jgi:hypothetical protein
MKEILSSIRTTRIHAFTKRRRPTYHFQHQNPLPAAALLFVVVVVIFACRASCVVCHRHGSCAGSSGSNGTWPCRAGAKSGSGSIYCRSLNARATCKSGRSRHSRHTRSFVQGSSHSCATPIFGRRCTATSPRLTARCQAERFRPTPSAGGVSSYGRSVVCLMHHRFTRHLSLCARPLGDPRRTHSEEVLARRLATGSAQCAVQIPHRSARRWRWAFAQS